MADEKILQDEILSNDELDMVVGGNSVAGRAATNWLINLQENGLSDYIVYGDQPYRDPGDIIRAGGKPRDIVAATCQKYGIVFKKWATGEIDEDSILINGVWYGLDSVPVDYFRKKFTGQEFTGEL